MSKSRTARPALPQGGHDAQLHRRKVDGIPVTVLDVSNNRDTHVWNLGDRRLQGRPSGFVGSRQKQVDVTKPEAVTHGQGRVFQPVRDEAQRISACLLKPRMACPSRTAAPVAVASVFAVGQKVDGQGTFKNKKMHWHH